MPTLPAGSKKKCQPPLSARGLSIRVVRCLGPASRDRQRGAALPLRCARVQTPHRTDVTCPRRGAATAAPRGRSRTHGHL